MTEQDTPQETQTLTGKALTRRLIAGLIFGFLVVLALALVGDLKQVGAQVLAFRWELFPIVIAFTLLNYFLRFLKWHFYLGEIGVTNLSYRESARLFVAGFPLAVTPGKVGEALKGVWLKQKTGVAVAKGISVVLAERISDGMAVILLATVGVIAYPQYWPGFAIVFTGLLGVIVVSQIRPLALWLLGIVDRIPLLKRISKQLHEFYEGSFALFRPRATLVGVGTGLVSWLGEGIGMYLVLIGLGVPAGWKTLSIAIFVLSFSTVIGAVSALPGGLGAAEASITGMLVLLLDIQTDTAAAATLLIRFATLWFAVTLGLIVWAFSRELLGMGNNESE
ncbi:MAG: flippase-like domain-containing protein [Anaerolineales bacterium]|nr:flippase-like domain-containing protein [Anaerolineales bacterium]